MAIYGITKYGGPPATLSGDAYYGYSIPPQYLVDPFIAQVVNYNSVYLTWKKPQGTILAFRLIKNRYGFPASQDDGQILIDSTSYPGNSFVDTQVIAGGYHYYSVWLLIAFAGNVWVKAGNAACLATKDYQTSEWLSSITPIYFRNIPNTELTTDTEGNIYLKQFYEILAFGLDQIKTQYDTYLNINNPWTIPLSDLYNLAAQLGLNIVPGISPYTLRKAIYNSASINKQRGTPQGIAEEITALTGWSVDLQVGPNLMLENDQSFFPDPFYSQWSPNISYNSGERVSYQNYIYVSNVNNNYNVAPTGANSNNANWNVIYNVDDSTNTLANSTTGWYNTWEPLYPSATNGIASAGSLKEGLGILNPNVAGFYGSNDLRVYNKGGSAQDVWARSVSRSTTDISNPPANFAPNQTQVIRDGIPVPYLIPQQTWNASTIYQTGQIVSYGGRPYLALRRSQGAVPPISDTATPEWESIGYDNRIRLMFSGYFSQGLTAGTPATIQGTASISGAGILIANTAGKIGAVATLIGAGNVSAQIGSVTPFVEWYDQNGNFISRVFARDPVPGTPNKPDQLCYDSFTISGTGNLNAHSMDTRGSSVWSIPVGAFTVSDFMGGSVYPAVHTTRSYAITTTGQSNCQVGVTFFTVPDVGWSQGIVFRWTDDNNYFRADYTTLKVKNAGVWSTLGTYSTAFQAGDRMVVSLGGTSISVLRNGVQVLAVTSSFNQSAINHGLIYETT